MKKRISDKARIEHMLDAITQIQDFTTGVSYEEYQQDLKLRLALTRLVEIIGEAANHVSESVKRRFTNVEWALLNHT